MISIGILIALFLGNMFSMLMIEELDRRRQDSSLDSNFGFTRRVGFHTFRGYRNSCPNGKLHIYALAAFALAIIALIGLLVFVLIAHQAPVVPT